MKEREIEIGARANLALPSKGMVIGTEVLVTDMATVSMGGFLHVEVEYNGKTFKGVHLEPVEFLSAPEIVPRLFDPALLDEGRREELAVQVLTKLNPMKAGRYGMSVKDLKRELQLLIRGVHVYNIMHVAGVTNKTQKNKEDFVKMVIETRKVQDGESLQCLEDMSEVAKAMEPE